MLGAKYGLGQFKDRAVQTMDPYFAWVIYGLHVHIAIFNIFL